MPLDKENPGAVTLLQAVIFLQFGTSFFITVMTTVGISFGYSVASYFLMALLQVLVAIPGIVHIALQGNIWVAIYIAFQLVTSVCEIYWLCVMIIDNQTAGRWVGLLLLTLINVAAVIIGIWFRKKALKMPCKKKDKKEKSEKKNEKPKMEAPSASMSEVEKSKARSSKESSVSSKQNSPKKDESISEKSSKGKLKVRKVKKSSMPLDSRETTSSKTIKSAQSTQTVTEN